MIRFEPLPIMCWLEIIIFREIRFCDRAGFKKRLTLNPKFLNTYIPWSDPNHEKKYSQAVEAFQHLPDGISIREHNKHIFQSYVYAAQGI